MSSLRTYELVLLLRYDVLLDDVKSTLNSILSILPSKESKILNAEYWGLRKLEYEIKKNTNAHYYMITIKCDNTLIPEIEAKIRISDIVIRHLILNVSDMESENTESSFIVKDAKSDTSGSIVYDEKYKDILRDISNLSI